MFIEELRNVRLFSHLSDDALKGLSERLRLYRYRKGNIVMREGDIGRSMYIIRSGQVEVVSESQSRSPDKVIAEFGPGEPVGELALLLGRRRSASVRVVIDAELWELRKNDLDQLIDEHPSLGLAFSREIAIRLIDWHEPPKPKSTKLMAVLGQRILHLAWHLYHMTGDRILLLNLGGVNYIPPNGPAYVTIEQLDDDAKPELLLNRLSEVLGHYDRVLMAVPSKLSTIGRKAIEQAEVVIEVSQEPTLWVSRSASTEKYWHYANPEQSIPQIARRLVGKRVGLALSSGYARSIAHLGVLYALERAEIPIDMLVATNGGGLFGALYAMGKSFEEIVHLVQDIASLYSWRSISALNNIIPRMGFVRGQRVEKVLNKAFGKTKFKDTRIKLALLAADMMTGEEVLLESGLLADATQATISSIPLFEPVQVGEQWLIDGAAINPLPTSALLNDTDIIIASSVIMSRQERIRRKATMRKSEFNSFMNLFSNKDALMEAGLIEHSLGNVDFLIEPDVALFDGFDFDHIDQLIEAGIRAAEPMIPSIKQKLYPPLRKRLTKI